MSKQNKTDHPLYNTWRKIKEKHYNKSSNVHMCARWLYSFEMFTEDVGDRPGDHFKLKRIKKTLPYDNSNVIWIQNKTSERGQITLTPTVESTDRINQRSVNEGLKMQMVTVSKEQVKMSDVKHVRNSKGYSLNDDIPDLM